ncbi:hypothetical protein MYSTI_02551 [Myxococcus stipitatus DSM 14675]|uniref:Lipoprotein n=1 Tax=Myxococcus stipitatus (strain DSM 14675 / JCM 12634 / Mx s8) TaxID=1278073 RepID=L7U8I0_MYXSD|nr:hypothetical protein MYSTI_02551 [Myxococcus stipitatus DSM 14675]
MRRIGSALLSVSLLVGCGPTGETPPPPADSPESQSAPLTTTDVDVAPECQGILTFVNTASFATLDAYLPSNAVANLVAQRTTAPFTTLAQVSAVSLVGEYRLTQIEGGARAQGFIGGSCVGIVDELAVSTDDAAAIVSLVNTASAQALHSVLPLAWNGATNLLNLRPFTSVQAIANTAGIGTVSIRALRNTATMGYSIEALGAAVNSLPPDDWTVKFDFDFDEVDVMWSSGEDRITSATCFGIDPSSFPASWWGNRPNLANATEVRNYITSAVSTANRNHQIESEIVTEGLSDLESHIVGHTFKGCHLGIERGPWAGVQVSFFIDTTSNFRVMTQRHWVE